MFATWAVTPRVEEDTEKTVTSLNSVGAGVLVDLGGWLYLAPSYAHDFGTKNWSEQPRWMFGIGLGPEMLDFLADLETD